MQWPALNAIKRGERQPAHFCGDHYEERCRRLREQGHEITFTDAALELLTTIDRPVTQERPMDTPEKIVADFADWHVWPAEQWDNKPGDWVPTRRDPAAGADATVMVNTAEQMRETLRKQRDRVAKGF